MAGHSKFSNIKHRKGAQDEKRAKVFNKIAREIEVATKLGGADPDANPRLRGAISTARGANMPKDRIDGAIKKGSGEAGGENYDEIRYEGYAPGGIAIIVETLTDNRNRTASDVRSTFTKFGGSLGETGSVSYMFDQVGLIIYPTEKADADSMFEAALEAGAEECESDEYAHEITCQVNDFNTVRDSLADKFGDPETARLAWKPQNTIAVDEDKARSILKLVEVLEDNDDVQNVSGNYEIADDILEKLSDE